MKKLIRDQRFRFFGLVIGLLIISIGGINPVQAAQEGPPIDPETLTIEERQRLSGGVITPFETSFPAVQEDEFSETNQALLDPAARDQQIREAERVRVRRERYSELVNQQNFIGTETYTTVLPAATNDDLASATVIGSLPYSDSVDTTAATLEGGEPAYTCGYSHAASVWYSFSPASDGHYVIDTATSNFNTVIHVFNTTGMTSEGCDLNSLDYYRAELAFFGAVGETYLISIAGSWGASGDLTMNLRETTAFASCGSVEVSQPECAALRNLYNTTGGDSWTNNNGWKQTAEVCTWFGVICSSGQIENLVLNENNLVGTLSTDLTALSNLDGIDIGNNSLSGDIGDIGALFPSTLLNLYLPDNAFTGTFSSNFLSLTSLRAIDAGGNQISGDLGALIGNLPTGMQDIWLRYNNITGTIPSSLLGFTSFWGIDVSGNQLAGDIADVFVNLPSSIVYLNLGYNDFYGTMFPAAAASLTSLDTIFLSANQLSGDLAGYIDNLPATMEYLYLDNNEITGTIPATISNLVILSSFTLHGNDGLLGTIPLSITSLPIDYFQFYNTYLCEPGDASYGVWKATVSSYYDGFCGNFLVDLTVLGTTFLPSNPGPSEAFTVTVHVRNIGGADSGANTWVDLYIDRAPAGCTDYGDYSTNEGTMIPGEQRDVVFDFPGGMAEAVYDINAYIEIDCLQTEVSEVNNQFYSELNVKSLIFTDGFESGDLSSWSSVNTGGGNLAACNDAAITDVYGACVQRGGNDKRKQLKDETPTAETTFAARFNFDINSMSMANGERFRFVQFKMVGDRPAFIVLKYQDGQYLIQLNTLLDDLTKVKTAWIPLPDAATTIEVEWQQSTGASADDGYARLFLNDLLQEELTGLDNFTLNISSFRLGFTSKLAGKSISGTFYIDDVATSAGGHIGLP